MKNLLTFLLLFSISSVFSKQLISENKKLAELCKIWGFLKYYHPNVSSGKFDWDEELFNEISKIKSTKTDKDFNREISLWINKLGTVNHCDSCRVLSNSIVLLKPDIAWIDDHLILDNEVIHKLKYILDNRNQGDNIYVKIQAPFNPVFSENAYSNLTEFSLNYRLLALFRFWNMVQYFYPYKYLIGINWEKELETDFIPQFLRAQTTLEYKLTVWRMINSIHDTHAGLYNRDQELQNFLGGYNKAAVRVRFIEDKLVIVKVYSDTTNYPLLKNGDVITSINNKTVLEKIKFLTPYSSGSNNASVYLNIAKDILWVNSPETTLEIERNEKKFRVNVPNFTNKEFQVLITKATNSSRESAYRLIKNDVGYADVSKLSTESFDQMFTAFKDTKGIIFDLRSYPGPDFGIYMVNHYLKSKPVEFAKYSKTSTSYPGLFTYSKPFVTGENNDSAYKRKIAVIVNEGTQSAGEFTAMIICSGSRGIAIGSQTSGADGNVSSIVLPGGLQTNFSGIGIYYPNGQKTQRIGIVPQIYVAPTIKGIQNAKDEVLDKAIGWIHLDN